MDRRRTLVAVTATVSALFAATAAAAQAASAPAKKREPDLGDVAEGSFFGSVISDSKGPSRDDVTLTITRIGVNRVRITSDYARLPVVEVRLTLALGRVVQAGGDTAFVLDRTKTPTRLDVSFNNEVSWSGERR